MPTVSQVILKKSSRDTTYVQLHLALTHAKGTVVVSEIAIIIIFGFIPMGGPVFKTITIVAFKHF